MNSRIAPGPWLRVSALVAAGGTLLAVVSGAEGLGTTHRLLAALVAPPLAALIVSAWYAHRRLVPAALAAAALFAAAAAVPGPHAHSGLAAFALAALVVVVAESFRGERTPYGSWRDYVDPDEAQDHVAAPRQPVLRDDRRRSRLARRRARRRCDGRSRAGLRRRVGAQPRARPRHRPADGRADALAPRRLGPRGAEPGARVRARAFGVLVRPARERGERADGSARSRRQPLLRPRLHALAQALHARRTS